MLVASVGYMGNAYNVLLESLRGRDLYKDIGVGDNIILKWNSQKTGTERV